MRALSVTVLLASATAAASPYDVGWAGVAITLGPRPSLHGDLGDRSERADCNGSTCSLGGRFGFGGGFGRWGADLGVAVIPFTDTTPMAVADRTAQMWGPHVRYSVLRWHGLDISLRTGVERGTLDADDPKKSTDVTCTAGDPPRCTSTTTEEAGFPAWALSGGVTLAWRARIEGGGYVGLEADIDATLMRAEYPDRVVTGMVTGQTFGIVIGTMFDFHP